MNCRILWCIGVIRELPNGSKREVNLVSWHEGTPKIDIRAWDADHEKCGKGISLKMEDAEKVAELLTDFFKEAYK